MIVIVVVSDLRLNSRIASFIAGRLRAARPVAATLAVVGVAFAGYAARAPAGAGLIASAVFSGLRPLFIVFPAFVIIIAIVFGLLRRRWWWRLGRRHGRIGGQRRGGGKRRIRGQRRGGGKRRIRGHGRVGRHRRGRIGWRKGRRTGGRIRWRVRWDGCAGGRKGRACDRSGRRDASAVPGAD